MRKSTVILLFIIGFILVFTISGVIAFEAISDNEGATDNINSIDTPVQDVNTPVLPDGGVTKVTPGINPSDAIVTHGDEEHNVADAAYIAQTEPADADEPEVKKEEKATEKPTEKKAEKATEKKKSAEEPTEKKSEKATEKKTEKSTEKATEKATEKVTEKVTEKATEKVTEKATEKATEKKAVEKEPEEKETEAPVEKPTEKPKLDPDTHYSDTGL